jgi:hypothetical protein
MSFEVVWIAEAEGQLADIWLNAFDRDIVRIAALEIDRVLTIDPINSGESRSAGQRILHVYPLGVRYMLLDDEKTVQVLCVWQFRKRAPGG